VSISGTIYGNGTEIGTITITYFDINGLVNVIVQLMVIGFVLAMIAKLVSRVARK